MKRLESESKNKTQLYSVYNKNHFKYKNKDKLQLNGWRKINYSNAYQKTAGVATLISDSRLRNKKSYQG